MENGGGIGGDMRDMGDIGNMGNAGPSAPSALDALTPTLSQRHSLWVGVPALRNLSPPLYECIRRMASDLHAQENLAHSLQNATDSATMDLRRYVCLCVCVCV
jgi:hypothetical protein